METEAGVGVVWVGRYLIRIRTDRLEEAVDDEGVVVEVRVQRGAETMQEADGPERGIRWCGGAGLPQRGLESPEQVMEDGRGGPGPVVEEGSERKAGGAGC